MSTDPILKQVRMVLARDSAAVSADESDDLVLTVDEAAALVKCSPLALRAMAEAGEVPATKIGRRWVLSRRLLVQWLEARCLAPKGQGLSVVEQHLTQRLKAQKYPDRGQTPKKVQS